MVHSAYGWHLVGKGSPKLGLPLGLPFYTRYYVIQGTEKSREIGVSVSSLTSVKIPSGTRDLTNRKNVF